MSKSSEKVKKKYANKWTDDKVELLLTVTKEHKANCQKNRLGILCWQVWRDSRSLQCSLCLLFIDNNLKTSCRSLKYWLCKFITAAFIWTHDIKLEIRATNKEATTLLYAMFVYNARREDWIQENDVSVFEDFRIRPSTRIFVSDKKISTLESVFKTFPIRPENTLDACGRMPYS